MKVSELIAYLQKQPQDLIVVFRQYSEHRVLEPNLIETERLCLEREDGRVQNLRPDKANKGYLVFPGK